MANPAAPPPTVSAPGKSDQNVATFRTPSFYVTSRQPLRPGTILLAIVVAAGLLGSILYVMSRGATNTASGQRSDDDPDQVDVILIGDPAGAPRATDKGKQVSPVHPTILVHLPRFGDQVGLIPNTGAGHLLYDWLFAFNQANGAALANALPTAAAASSTAAQLELRRMTGGLSLLSAKEVAPGILVFRLRDQTPQANEVLGTIQVRPNTRPPTIASFSLRAGSLAPSAAPAKKRKGE